MKGARIRYSLEELAFLEEHATHPRKALHAWFVHRFKRTDVTADNIKGLCTRNGWNTPRRPWTAENDQQLRELYPHHKTEKVAKMIGRTLQATNGRASTLELSKTAEYLASPDACRLRREDSPGVPYRFKKGQAPANKGLRRPGWGPGRMKETQFKKGEPTNWMPVGSHRTIDGYDYTKISDVRNVSHMVNWKPTHRLRWEALHGPIPKGKALKCLGEKSNTDPANWVLVSRGLLPRLNGIHGHGYDQAPAELRPTILALAQLEQAAHERRKR